MKSTQSDRGLEFDGVGSGPSRGSSKYAGNHWAGVQNPNATINHPGQQRTGAVSRDPAAKNVGASVTKDSFRRAPDRVGSGARPSNSDSINVGSQYRGSASAAVRKPANPDSIRVGQSGGNSYGEISRGRTPVNRGGENFNYGPKSQY
jgi:hypothetical protein